MMELKALTAKEILALPRLIMDFETYSELDLGEVGTWRYAEHHSTEILCMGYILPGSDEDRIWYPGLPFPQEVLDHIAAGYPVEAHNVAMEQSHWHFHFVKKLGFPQVRFWIDTMAACAYRGVPQKLKDVGSVLNLKEQKDESGTRLLNLLSRPQKPTKKNPETRRLKKDYPHEYERLYAYCRQDVRTEKELGWTIGDLSPSEYHIWMLDQKVNHRGVMVDVSAAYAAKRIVDALMEKLQEELYFITNNSVETVNQRDRFLAWAERQGYFLPNLQAETVEKILKLKEGDKGRPNDLVYRALQIRQQLAKASTNKLIKFIECISSDLRIRGLLQYHGAGTGRWAGRLVQPQNFPRGTIKWKKQGSADELIECLIDAISYGDAELLELFFGDPMAAIATALRGMFIPAPGKKFMVADFSAIEARVVMWLAGAEDAVQAFYDNDADPKKPDIYCVMAEAIHGYPCNKNDHPKERQLGKTVILGCGYQMSGAKLRIQSAAELERAGIEPLSEERADELVKLYREKYPEVVALWRGLEDAAIECVKTGESTSYGRIGFEIVNDNAGKWLAMILPNGRRLWYFRPALYPNTIRWFDKKKGEWKEWEKDALCYEGRDNKLGGAWSTVSTYGGMLTENAVQAIARDLMVAAMVRCERAGYPVVLTVHDEIVAEVPEGFGTAKEFEHIVRGPNPKWAEGCPVNAEGWEGKRYRK